MTAPTLPDLVARLEALEKEATPGPWIGDSVGEKCTCLIIGVAYDMNDEACEKQLAGWPEMWDAETGKELVYRDQVICEIGDDAQNARPDARLIVAMRNALPQLLTELKRLQEENERLQSEAETAHAARRFASDKCAEEIGTLRSANERLKSENEQLNHSKILVPEATPELIEKAREIRENRTSEMDALRSANERMRAALVPFKAMYNAYMGIWPEEYPALSDNQWVGRTQCGGATVSNLFLGDLRRAAEAVGDE